MYTHKIVNGVQVDLTAEEIAEITAQQAAYIPSVPAPAPTKEELLAELQALSAKINAME